MPIAQGMKQITEEIEVSYGERMAFLADLVKETNQTLKTFNQEHQKMATDLWGLLLSDRSNRATSVRKMRAENIKELKEMAQKLAEFLSSSETERMKDFTTLIGEIKGAVAAIEKDIAETLADFRSSHREMSEAQRAELVRITKELERTVREMRAPVIADLKEAKRNWQNLAKIMAAKRTGKRVPITEAPKEVKVPKKIEEAAEKAFSEGELKRQMMRLIAENAQGITLPQIGKALGVPYVRLARPVNALIEEGKVKKQDSQYFSV